MATLEDLLPIRATKTIDELRGLWLMFDLRLALILKQIHQTHGDSRHVASPITLTNGKYALCADLLSEIESGGLYHKGFIHLPSEEFGNIEVIGSSEFAALLPEE